MGDLKRAAEYRARADALGIAARNLPPEAQAVAQRHQNGLRQLADVEEWIALPPRPANTKHDLGLAPSSEPNDILAKLIGRPGKPRGRVAQRIPPVEPAPIAKAEELVVAPICPDCAFAMTPLCRTESLPNVRLFECRPCGIIKTPVTS